MSDDGIPLERYQRIAEFRASLRSFLRHNEQVCRRAGLTPQRFLLLLAIKGEPSGSGQLSVSDLAERLQLSPNTVTELCVRAEDAGLVTREQAGHDQRVVHLRVTAEGERRLAEVVRSSDEFRDELIAAFASLSKRFRSATHER